MTGVGKHHRTQHKDMRALQKHTYIHMGIGVCAQSHSYIHMGGALIKWRGCKFHRLRTRATLTCTSTAATTTHIKTYSHTYIHMRSALIKWRGCKFRRLRTRATPTRTSTAATTTHAPLVSNPVAKFTVA